MNWKSYVEKKNAKVYVLPHGWDSRDVVAAQLDCSPEKVDDNLRPSLKSGEVIKQQFRVWDAGLSRLTYVTAYQVATKPQPAAETPANGQESAKAGPLVDKIRALKAAGKSYNEIAREIGLTYEQVRGHFRVR